MSRLPIDFNFRKQRRKVGREGNVAIWGPLNPPLQLGIRGTHAAVDWDICTVCGICVEICPQRLYEWVQTPNHPTSERKPLPARERECVQCYRCEAECPVQAIRVVAPDPTGFGRVMDPLFFLQVVGGIVYGTYSGPALGISILFWVGWAMLAVAIPLFLSIAISFKKTGKPGKGKSVIDTTVLVDTGTYAVVRHPQTLGGMLMVFASLLISQHWLAAILGVAVSAWYYREIVKEEKGLLVKFGDKYEEYMQRVPRMNLLTGTIRLLKHRNQRR